MARGWHNESRRHSLSALGIPTSRKQYQRKGKTTVLNGNSSMFYPEQKTIEKAVKKKLPRPKKDTKDITVNLPITAIKKAEEVVRGK